MMTQRVNGTPALSGVTVPEQPWLQSQADTSTAKPLLSLSSTRPLLRVCDDRVDPGDAARAVARHADTYRRMSAQLRRSHDQRKRITECVTTPTPLALKPATPALDAIGNAVAIKALKNTAAPHTDIARGMAAAFAAIDEATHEAPPRTPRPSTAQGKNPLRLHVRTDSSSSRPSSRGGTSSRPASASTSRTAVSPGPGMMSRAAAYEPSTVTAPLPIALSTPRQTDVAATSLRQRPTSGHASTSFLHSNTTPNSPSRTPTASPARPRSARPNTTAATTPKRPPTTNGVSDLQSSPAPRSRRAGSALQPSPSQLLLSAASSPSASATPSRSASRRPSVLSTAAMANVSTSTMTPATFVLTTASAAITPASPPAHNPLSPPATGRSVGGAHTARRFSSQPVSRLHLDGALAHEYEYGHSVATTQRAVDEAPTVRRQPDPFFARTPLASSRPATAPTRPSTATAAAKQIKQLPSASPSRRGFADVPLSMLTSRANLSSIALPTTATTTTTESDATSPSEVIHSAVDPAVAALHRAVKSGDLEQTMRLLWRRDLLLKHSREDDDATTTTPTTVTNTARAIYAPADVRDRNGSTPLFHAAWMNDLPLLRLLLAQQGDDVGDATLRNLRDNSALEMSVERSAVGATRLLLAHGAKLSHGALDRAQEAHRLQLLSDRATYELDDRLVNALRARLERTPHKAVKLAQMVKAGATERLATALRTNPASVRRWARDLRERGLTMLGIAAWHGHEHIARIIASTGIDIDAACFVARDGRMLAETREETEGSDQNQLGSDEEDEDEEEEEDQAIDDGSNANTSDAEEARAVARAERRLARETNAFGVAFEQGHYKLAALLLDLGASPRFAPALLPPNAHTHESNELQEPAGDTRSNSPLGEENSFEAAASAPPPLGPRAREHAAHRLEVLIRMQSAANELRHCLVSLGAHGGDDRAALRATLMRLCRDMGRPSLEACRALIQFPDAFGRCAIHVAISLRMPHCLDHMLATCGFHANNGAEEEDEPEKETETKTNGDSADFETMLDPSPLPPLVLARAALDSRDSLRRLTAFDLALETDDLAIIMQLLRVARRPSLRSIMQALDRIQRPHSRLSEEHGLIAMQFTLERLRAAARLRRAHREQRLAVARALAASRGEIFDPAAYGLDHADDDVLTMDSLVRMLNATSIGAQLAGRIVRALLPGLQADRAERGLDPLPNESDILARLHATARAQGRDINAEGSSGYGRASSGLSAFQMKRRARLAGRRKNRLHDAAYLARLLAKQRAHAARERTLWASAQAASRMGLLDAQELEALRRMEGATLTPRRRALLTDLFSGMQSLGRDTITMPPNQEEADAEAEERARHFQNDMTSDEAKRHREAMEKANREADAAADDVAQIDWAQLAKMSGVSLATAEEKERALAECRANLPFEMNEIIEFNPRLLTAGQITVQPSIAMREAKNRRVAIDLHVAHFAAVPFTSYLLSPAAANARSVGPSPPSAPVAPPPLSTSSSTSSLASSASFQSLPVAPPATTFAPRRLVSSLSLDEWLRCWQEQAWDEGLHSIDVFLHEAARRRDRQVRRRDWLPLGFLWPNTYSQTQAARAAERRMARLERMAQRAADELSGQPTSRHERRKRDQQRRADEAEEENDDEYRHIAVDEASKARTLATLMPEGAFPTGDTRSTDQPAPPTSSGTNPNDVTVSLTAEGVSALRSALISGGGGVDGDGDGGSPSTSPRAVFTPTLVVASRALQRAEAAERLARGRSAFGDATRMHAADMRAVLH